MSARAQLVRNWTEVELENAQSSPFSVDGFVADSSSAPSFKAKYGVERIHATPLAYPNGVENTGFYAALGAAFDGTVSSIAAQPDGKLVIGGLFSNVNGSPRTALVRLNVDGSEDLAFNANLFVFSSVQVNAVLVLSTGKILVGGAFQTYNGATRRRLIRLNADGTEDTSFYTNLGTSFNATVFALCEQADGKLLVGGSFNSFNGNGRGRIVRLNSNGTEDTAFGAHFSTGFNSQVNAILQLPDTSVLVGGSFSTLNGVSKNRLAKVNAAGVTDATFNNNFGTGFDNTVSALALEPQSGKVVVGGSFTSFDGRTRRSIARILQTGHEDAAFYATLTSVGNGIGFNTPVLAVSVEGSGKVVAVGTFSTLNGVSVGFIARLESSGLPDAAFNAAFATGFDSNVLALAVTPDRQLVVGGAFAALNGLTRNSLVELYSDIPSFSDGSQDTTFLANTGTGFSGFPSGTAVQSDGKYVMVSGGFWNGGSPHARSLVRVNRNGTEDLAFRAALGVGFNGAAHAVYVLSGGDILVGGPFTTFNGLSRSLLERMDTDGFDVPSFYTNLGTGFTGGGTDIHAILEQADGKILVGGQYTSFNGNGCARLVRLNPNGTEDTAFTANLGTGFDDVVFGLNQQVDGKILVSGSFSSLNGSGVAPCLVRLNADGTLDTTFNTNLGTGFNSTAFKAVALRSQQILVAGFFTSFNGNARLSLVRLNADGTEDAGYYTNLGTGFDDGIFSIALQSDDGLVCGGSFLHINGDAVQGLARIDATGTPDVAFNTALGTGSDAEVDWVAMGGDNEIVAGGQFSNFNGVARSGHIVALGLAPSSPATATELIETGSFDGLFEAGAWSLAGFESEGPASGVVFNITAAGQVQYTSTEVLGATVSSKLRFQFEGRS